MAKIDGGEMLVRTLEQEGVREIFTLHGGHLDAIYAACGAHGFRVIDTRHEQAAAHMADGWARTTGRPGVAIVTAGPGVTDAVTGVANAFMDSIPMILIGGRSPLADDDQLPLQAVDQMGILRPITKWARSVTHTERIPEYLAAAFRHAISGRPGPVFLELPIDVLFARVDEDHVEFPKSYRPKEPAGPGRAALTQALKWLREAKRPAILAGGGVWFAQASEQLTRFAELTNTPVMTNAKARGSISEEHPLCFGSFGAIHPAIHAKSGGSADLVILLGTRIGMFTGGRNSVIPADARVIQVDIEPEEIGRNRNIELGIVSDCGEFLRQALEAAKEEKFDRHEEWIERLNAVRSSMRHRFDDALKDGPGPIHPARMVHEIAKTLSPDAIVVADGGETASWMSKCMDRAPARTIPLPWLSRMLGNRTPVRARRQGGASRQTGLLHRGRRLGRTQFLRVSHCREKQLANHRRNQQRPAMGDVQAWAGTDVGKGTYYGYRTRDGSLRTRGRGSGAQGELVERAVDIAPALKRALASGRPACLNIITDRDVIEPGTLAMYSAGLSGPAKEKSKTDSGSERETTLPYYGKRKLD